MSTSGFGFPILIQSNKLGIIGRNCYNQNGHAILSKPIVASINQYISNDLMVVCFSSYTGFIMIEERKDGSSALTARVYLSGALEVVPGTRMAAIGYFTNRAQR